MKFSEIYEMVTKHLELYAVGELGTADDENTQRIIKYFEVSKSAHEPILRTRAVVYGVLDAFRHRLECRHIYKREVRLNDDISRLCGIYGSRAEDCAKLIVYLMSRGELTYNLMENEQW